MKGRTASSEQASQVTKWMKIMKGGALKACRQQETEQRASEIEFTKGNTSNTSSP